MRVAGGEDEEGKLKSQHAQRAESESKSLPYLVLRVFFGVLVLCLGAALLTLARILVWAERAAPLAEAERAAPLAEAERAAPLAEAERAAPLAELVCNGRLDSMRILAGGTGQQEPPLASDINFPCGSHGPSLLPIDLCYPGALAWLKRRKYVLTGRASEQMGYNRKVILSMCVFARGMGRILVEPCYRNSRIVDCVYPLKHPMKALSEVFDLGPLLEICDIVPYHTFRAFQAEHGGPQDAIGLYDGPLEGSTPKPGTKHLGTYIKEMLLASIFLENAPPTTDLVPEIQDYELGLVKYMPLSSMDDPFAKGSMEEPILIFPQNLRRRWVFQSNSVYWNIFLKAETCFGEILVDREWKLRFHESDDELTELFKFQPAVGNELAQSFLQVSNVEGNFDVFQWRAEHIPDMTKVSFCAAAIAAIMKRYIEETGRKVVLVSDISFTKQKLSGTFNTSGHALKRSRDVLMESGALKLETMLRGSKEDKDTSVLAAADIRLFSIAENAFTCTRPSPLCKWCTKPSGCSTEHRKDPHPDLYASSFTLMAASHRAENGASDIRSSWLDALEDVLESDEYQTFTSKLESILSNFECRQEREWTDADFFDTLPWQQ